MRLAYFRKYIPIILCISELSNTFDNFLFSCSPQIHEICKTKGDNDPSKPYPDCCEKTCLNFQ